MRIGLGIGLGVMLALLGCAQRKPLEPLVLHTVEEEIICKQPTRHEGCKRQRTLSIYFELQYPVNDPAVEAWVASLVGGELYDRICQSFFLPGEGLEKTPFVMPKTVFEAMNRICFGGMAAHRLEREEGDILEFDVPCKGECLEPDARDYNVKEFACGMKLKLIVNDVRFCSCEAIAWQAPFGTTYGRDVRSVFDRVNGKRFTFEDLIHPRKRVAFKKFFSVYLSGGTVEEARAAEKEPEVEVPEEMKVFFDISESTILNEQNTWDNFTFMPEGVFWSELQNGRSYRNRLFPWEILRPYLRDKTLADRFRKPPQKGYPQK